MVLDFTLDKYRELCSALLENHYIPLTFSEYLENGNALNSKFTIIRHDVDRKSFNALKMAELENELGIRSTYYFRYPYTFKLEIIKKIIDLGHEIGYHYEVLSKANGNYDKAINLFNYELAKFREICNLRSICMHGCPLSRYDNRALWDIYDFKNFGILGEAYLSVESDIVYFSDTGREWSGKNSLRDFIPGKKNRSNISSTSELIEFIERGEAFRIYVLSHPERWASSRIEWLQSYAQDITFNIGKRVLGAMR